MRNTLIIFLLTILISACSSNKSTFSPKIDLQTKLIRTYDTIISWDTTKYKAFDILINITNKSDSSISFWLMTCSWQWNFKINNDYIQILSEGCPSNFPAKINLKANESLIRKASTIKHNNTFGQFIKSTKFGFVLIDTTECRNDDDFLSFIADLSKQYKIIWSNELFLND